jgi:hypothetical protein
VFKELNTYTAVVYLKKVSHPAPARRPPPDGGAVDGNHRDVRSPAP